MIINSDVQKQIDRIVKKIVDLKRLDVNFNVFGSEKHNYKLNRIVPEKEILEFERENKIVLPIEYKAFIFLIGNGGAGPYYGLEPLENGKYANLDYKNETNLVELSLPFSQTEHWNIELEEFDENNIKKHEEKEALYFDNKWVNGLLKISNFGCGVAICLVVNGAEYGNIWVDDRCNNQGIFPDSNFENKTRLNFLDWYELWLDREIKNKMD